MCACVCEHMCFCTFCPPKADRLTLLLVKEAVVVSFTAAVDEGSAGLNMTVEVPAQCVSFTAALLHGQQAHTGWIILTHTHTHIHQKCARSDTTRSCTIKGGRADGKQRRVRNKDQQN